jgi:Uma2 family endonuclease
MALRRAPRPTTEDDPATQQAPEPRLFTIDEYYKMAEVGILRPDERVELIEGVIVTMSPIGGRHVFAVIRLNRLFAGRLLDVADISVQNPVRLAVRVEPEPDFAIIAVMDVVGEGDDPAPPGPTDVRLIVEVAETSVRYDIGKKAELYARHGIPELWVLDLIEDRLIVHRDPTPDGYASVRTVARGEAISPLAFPAVTFTIEEILG